MNSTSTSETILKVENLSLAYDLSIHQKLSLRDQFVDWAKNPIRNIMRPKNIYPVLENISFEIKKGERVGLIGVNGAGKTSLCRCIAGMIKQTSGKIDINGKVRAIFNTTSGIMPVLTGRENIEILSTLLYSECSDQELKDIIEDATNFCELGDFMDAPFHTYSRGMQARLFLSLISARPTDLLILDEVFDGADEFFQVKIANRVLKMIEGSGSCIFVSHSFDQIDMACNQVLILDKHKVLYKGPIEKGRQIYRFLGHEN